MSVVWKETEWGRKPYGKCGQITWHCPYEPTDPMCCQYADIQANKARAAKREYLEHNKAAFDAEYGPEVVSQAEYDDGPVGDTNGG
jgi:hypothetical protein